MASPETKRRPYKVWSCDRQTRKAIVVSTLRDLIERGGERLGYSGLVEVTAVLESDGTEVDDEGYFQTLVRDTVFLLLRPGEKWLPPGVEALRAAITAIPRIVCDAINTLELIDKQPSWKIMDNKGRVTVVLHWDQRDIRRTSADGRSSRPEHIWRVEVVQQDGQVIGGEPGAPGTSTFTTAKGPRAKLTLEGLGPRPPSRTLPRNGGDSDDLGLTEIEIVEEKGGSPLNGGNNHDHSLCDFHCSALHEEGAQIRVNKSVATSPIQEMIPESGPVAGPSRLVTGATQKKGVKGHVRFMDVTHESKIPDDNRDESESDTENTTNEDEQLSDRYLLLVDQLSLEQNRHLSVKDIGVILERLNSKIVDIERLERERESEEVHNWTIKATIRGEVLREIGVIYNGQYYGIMEHPGYF